MKLIQRIPRFAVRAVAAGSVLVAAALPLTAAGIAGAATPATLSGAALTATAAQQTVTATYASGAYYATNVSGNNGFTFTAGTQYTVAGTGITTGTTLTQVAVPAPAANTVSAVTGSTNPYTLTVTAGTYFAGEQLTAAITGSTTETVTVVQSTSNSTSVTVTGAAAPVAGALTGVAQTVYDFSAVTTAVGANAILTLTSTYLNEAVTGYAQIGQGSTGTMYIYGTGFSFNGSTVTVTSNAPGLTFSNATETVLDSANAFGYVAVTYTSTSATTPGYYSVTVQDGAGTTAALANAIVVNAAPVVTSISPSTLPQGAATTITVTGSGFTSATTLSLTASDGTKLKVFANSTASVQGATTNLSSTSLTAYVVVKNFVSGLAATTGAYSATVTNTSTDNGTSTTANAFNVSGYGITSVNPGWIQGNGTAQSIPVTISGTQFTPGGILTMTHETGASLGVTLSPSYTVTATSISATVLVPSSVTSASSPETYTFTFTNTSGIQTQAVSALGINQSSLLSGNSPTLTSVGTVPTLSYGSVQNLVLTGTNFAPGMTLALLSAGTTNDATGGSGVCSAAAVVSSTTATCAITVGSTWTAGADDAYVTTLAGTSSALANAITVAGPVITSSSPASLGIGQTSTVTLTGTGFTSTMTLGAGTSSTVGTLHYGSATQATVVVTTATALTNIQLSASGVLSPVFQITAGAPVTASTAVLGVTGPNGIGVGASAFPVTFTGSGFLPGATVTLPAAAGATVTVKSVTPGAITATVNVSSSATPAGYTFTVTNSNGGTGTSGANAIYIDAAPLLTATKFSSTSVVAGAAPITISVTGSNLSSTSTVASSLSLVTLGTPSYNSSTGTYSFTASAPAISGTFGVNLTLTFKNLDGGISTQAFSVSMQPTVTGAYYVPTFSTNKQVVVTGTGFESGMTVASSNAAYTVVLAQVATSTTSNVTTAVLLVTTTAAATAGTSSNVTFTNPDGGAVTFALNGGPAPTPTPVLTQPHVTGVSTFVKTGMTRAITLHGLHFMKGLRITSVAGTTWRVMGVNPTTVRVQVTVTKASRVGWHRLFLTNPNGKKTSRAYQQK